DIRIRSPSSAPPENGEDGSTASTPTRLPCERSARTSAEVVVDLPTPGAPVSPTTWALPVYGANAVITSRRRSDSPSTTVPGRATARAEPECSSPPRAVVTSWPTESVGRIGALGPRAPQDQGVALPAAPAQRRGTDAATATLELERQVECDARAG